MTTSLRISGLGLALVVAGGLLWFGCGGAHDDGFQEVANDDCVACHQVDYDNTRQPPHENGRIPVTCGSCHGSVNWRPPENPDLHPDEDFLISSGPHVAPEVGCSDCHDPTLDLSSFSGENTNCVGCHTGAHAIPLMDDVHKNDPEYPIGDPRRNFCLDCHRDGRCDPCEP